MSKKGVIQAGRSKEAYLAIVGGSGLSDDQKRNKIVTPENAEYQSYGELLKGYLEKLTSWHQIFTTKGHYELSPSLPWWWLRIKTSSNRFVIDPDMSHKSNYPPDTVFVTGGMNTNTDEFGNSFFYWMRPGQAGKEFFVDPERNPLTEVRFEVDEKGSLASLAIIADELFPSPENKSTYKGHVSVDYQLNRRIQKLTVKRVVPPHKLMSDSYVTHLFNTIDALIPGTPTATPQPERRATSETHSPNALPPARRRRPPGR